MKKNINLYVLFIQQSNCVFEMFEKVRQGWAMGSVTRRLVFKDKALLYYPLVGAVVGILEAIAIFAALFFARGSSLVYLVGLIAYYIIVFFTSTYILMAMFVAFRSFVNGEKIGMAQAFGKVRPYLKLILEWAVFNTIVVLVVRMIESKLGNVGRFIFGAVVSVGLAIATFFAVPVILDKKVGPIEAVKESSQFIIQHFSKTFGGFVYSDLYSLMFVLLGVFVLFAGVVAGIAASLPAVAVAAAAFGFVLMIFGALLSYTLLNIFKFVVYEHESGKPLPEGFSEDMIKNAVKQKRVKTAIV